MRCLLFCFGCCGTGVEGNFSARCLLFASKPCGTGVEDNAEKITPESATADHLKRKAKNKCRFLRGAGFGNLVERFFDNPCRFLSSMLLYSHLDYKSKLTSANVMDNVLTLPETEAVGWQT